MDHIQMGSALIELVTSLAKINPSIILAIRDSLSERLFNSSSKQRLLHETNLTADEFEEVLNEVSQELPKEEFELTLQSSLEKLYQERYHQLDQIYKEQLKRERLFNTLSLVTLIMGTLLIAFGIFSFFSLGQSWTILIVSSVPPILISLFSFFLKTHEDRRLNDLSQELDLSARSFTAIKYIDQISDPDKRTKALVSLIEAILQI